VALKISNTLSGRKEEFTPLKPGEVTMYVCGVTVYASSHIGHAMSALTFDVIRRYLEYKGYAVRHVVNFTDIDDKIIKRAADEQVEWKSLTERYIKEYLDWMDALNVLRATVYPRATEEVDGIIAAIQTLIEKNNAYFASNGDVYFRALSQPNYGALKHQSPDELNAGSRIEVDEAKENALDFALWKAAKPGEPSWPSPWGPGRPGWHIECSAMALRHLGPQIDLHGGGADLIFPHHENEIAQSENLTGERPFVRYWAHNGLLQAKIIDPETGKAGVEKMSKSLGNTLSVGKLLEMGDPDMLRMFVLGSHYRNPLTYTDESFEVALRSLERLKAVFDPQATWGDPAAPGKPGPTTALEQAVQAARAGFEAAMDDDFNTPAAIARLYELVREIFKGRDSGASGKSLAAARDTLAELGGVLGLRMRELPPVSGSQDTEPFIRLLVDLRKELKTAKQYQLADRVREGLKELGVKLEDRPDGTIWKIEK
jgi:cysteinyl-tRNA synthetase